MNNNDPFKVGSYGSCIELNNGLYFDYLDPDPELIDISVIAGPLSRLCRFAGQTNDFYSVAQHSVEVYKLTGTLPGLFHDATEAFMADMPKPLKRLIPAYEEIEEKVWLAIAQAYGFNAELPTEVHVADRIMVLAEARDMLNTDTWKKWYPGLSLELVDEIPKIVPLPPAEAEQLFLDTYFEHLEKAA